jgi:hypothetical protein
MKNEKCKIVLQAVLRLLPALLVALRSRSAEPL